MGRRAPVVDVDERDERAEQERTNALRAERRAHLLAEGADGHTVDGWRDDCPACPVTRASGDARRRAAWLAG
jgi:hypothetical protein